MSDRGPSGHLLRTLAAVAPTARVVAVECGPGTHVEPLARLGFDVWACDAEAAHVETTRARLTDALGAAEADRRVTRARPDALGYPDAFAHWVVLEAGDLGPAVLAEAARVLAPGGWLWTETPDPEAFVDAAATAGLVVSEGPDREPGRDAAHVIVRRPGGIA